MLPGGRPLLGLVLGVAQLLNLPLSAPYVPSRVHTYLLDSSLVQRHMRLVETRLELDNHIDGSAAHFEDIQVCDVAEVFCRRGCVQPNGKAARTMVQAFMVMAGELAELERRVQIMTT